MSGGVLCRICPHACVINEGYKGFCMARANRGGVIVADSYGRISSLSLDPIEKKPLHRFHPGSMILSAGSYGCNLRCSFCQNHSISMSCMTDAETVMMSPEALLNKALLLAPRGNIGIAFTYNEPIINYEYVMDCARLFKENALKVVLVTNGYINEEPLLELLPLVDALNIDLKGFTEEFYQKLAGSLEPVKRSIVLAAGPCHVEVTTLIIPGENDSREEMERLSEWLASIDKSIPLHISRFFPGYRMTGKNSTPVETVYNLADLARKRLLYVYEGNC